MAKYFIGMIMLFFLSFLTSQDAFAGTYNNAYDYYSEIGVSETEPAHFNSDDGFIYFCSYGSTSVSNIRYRTVGYGITLKIGNKDDKIEVKLGGSYIKNVSEVEKDGYTYVLRRVKLSKLQTLFYGNTDITWNQIYMQKNKYIFNAIMTIVENGKQKCGTVSENDNRKVTAEKKSYLYRTADKIKLAANWLNPADLDNFFDKSVSFPHVNYIDTSEISLYNSGNVYNYGGINYVRKNSDINLYFHSYFEDIDAAISSFHPNYNLYHVSGWGSNQKIAVEQYKSAAPSNNQTYMAYDENTGNSPLYLKGINSCGTSNYSYSNFLFATMISCEFAVGDSKQITIIPEGRVYYSYYYPANIDEDEDLCNKKYNKNGAIKLLSDGKAPAVNAPRTSIALGKISVPITVSDTGSGIREISIYNNRGEIVGTKGYDGHETYIESTKDFYINPDGSSSYYVCAVDNVGNVGYSGWFSYVIPKEYTINANISGGYNGYNSTSLTSEVQGGNSEIAAFIVMSEAENNPNNKRVVLANYNLVNKALPNGLFSYRFAINPMDEIRDMKDGAYTFEVISGGRYIQSKQAQVTLYKDTTGPVIKYESDIDNYRMWFRKNVNFKVNVSDNYSGIDNVDVKCNNTKLYETSSNNYTISKEGVNKIIINARDRAGNESVMSQTYNIDKTQPIVLCSSGIEYNNSSNVRWFGKNQLNCSIKIRDYISGITPNDMFLYERKNGRSTEIPITDLFDIVKLSKNNYCLKLNNSYINNSSSSSNVYLIEAEDGAYNCTSKSFCINIDYDAPIIENKNVVWDPVNMKGSVPVTDYHSGISTIELYRNGVNVMTWDDIDRRDYTVSVDQSLYVNKTNELYLYVTDKVGNHLKYNLEIKKAVLGLNANICREDNINSHSFISGEKGVLNISVTGYADKLEVSFPAEYLKLSPSLRKTISLVPEPSYKTKISFKIPIDIIKGEYHAIVKAYKGERCLYDFPVFDVQGEIADELRTRIR